MNVTVVSGAVGVVTSVLVVFSLVVADFFDTMGTMVAVGAEAGLLDEEGNPVGAQRILLVDSLAAAAGGAASASSATSFVESAAGVGDEADPERVALGADLVER